MQNTNHRLFISYQSDQYPDVARPLADALLSSGYDVRIDSDQVSLGNNWVRRISEEISNCTAAIVILSESYFKSQHCKSELDALLARDVVGDLILPILFNMTIPRLNELRPQLSNLNVEIWTTDIKAAARIRSALRAREKTEATNTASKRKAAASTFTSAMNQETPQATSSDDLAEHLYWFESEFAFALRLQGAGSQVFLPRDVHCKYSNKPYVPDWLTPEEHQRVLSEIILENNNLGRNFSNGPCARAIEIKSTVSDVATERQALELTLAPLSWYEYSVVKRKTDEAVRRGGLHELKGLVDLEKIASLRTIASSKLHNIIDTATTLISRDGFVFFARRGKTLSAVPDLLTSAVAENVHREKDQWGNEQADAELPLPFRTVVRGTGEELSPLLESRLILDKGRIACTGVSYDLISFHPDLLFVACFDLYAAELTTIVREIRGRDWYEGALRMVRVDDSTEIRRILSPPGWTGGGKASLIRALELVYTLASERRCTPKEAAEFLCSPGGLQSL